jgi:hypothetical protein
MRQGDEALAQGFDDLTRAQRFQRQFEAFRRETRLPPMTEEELEGSALHWHAMAVAARRQTTSEVTDAMALECAMALAPRLAEHILSREWEVLHCRDSKSFITSDTPFVIGDSARPFERAIMGFGDPRSVFLFPLSQRMGLLMFGGRATLTHRLYDDEMLRRFNLTIASNSSRYVYGRDEALLRSIGRHVKGEAPPRALRLTPR